MKTVHQSLIDYDMALVQAIADCRGVTLSPANKREAILTLSEALLSPSALAVIMADLPAAEQQAVQFLLDQAGQSEAAPFTRQFGVIRPMGPARLSRERPWQHPVNPAEGLWYKGLIFKAFQTTLHGHSELIYIPTDLLPLMQNPAPDHPDPAPDQPSSQSVSSAKIFQFPGPNQAQPLPAGPSGPKSAKRGVHLPYLTLTHPPAQLLSAAGRLRESMFSLLVYLQLNPIRFKEESVNPTDIPALIACLPPLPRPGYSLAEELQLLLHLGQRTGLLTLKHGRLRPERETTRAWLQAHPLEQSKVLQNSWRADPTWNDLWHVPTLAPQPTGWENSPLLARSKILGYLVQAEGPVEGWLSLDSFIGAIKRLDPDFQRPHGDYDSWYIYDCQGNSLLGFAHWDQVEGALIRYIIEQVLFLLGLVELGSADKTALPTSFRITALGRDFLMNQPPAIPPPQKPLFLRLTPGFQAHVPPRANLYDRFQLARFAELTQREENRIVYQISQASVGRALRNGVTAEQIVAFLSRATNNQTPLKVVETLRTWGTRQGTARIERATLLRLKHENQLAQLQQHPALQPLLGEVLGPTTILIPAENTLQVRKILIELGYLTE